MEASQAIQAEQMPDLGLDAVLRDYMDVTRRLQDTHEVLQREVVRLREELASKDRELERRRRLAALGELAAGVAHEVRNPLGAIQLYSGLLRSEVRGQHLDEAIKLIEKIETGVQAIDGVVRDTLALAPRNGRVSPCVLSEILQRAADVCLSELQTHGVQLETDIADEALEVNGHPDGLQRVLVNLICNAAQASAPGTTVRVTMAPSDNGQVALRVRDQGAGIADEAMDRLFDPFFTTKDNGTGLGLTIAHRLIEAHGGELSAVNLPAGGAEFTILLPLAMSETAPRDMDAHGAAGAA